MRRDDMEAMSVVMEINVERIMGRRKLKHKWTENDAK